MKCRSAEFRGPRERDVFPNPRNLANVAWLAPKRGPSFPGGWTLHETNEYAPTLSKVDRRAGLSALRDPRAPTMSGRGLESMAGIRYRQSSWRRRFPRPCALRYRWRLNEFVPLVFSVSIIGDSSAAVTLGKK